MFCVLEVVAERLANQFCFAALVRIFVLYLFNPGVLRPPHDAHDAPHVRDHYLVPDPRAHGPNTYFHTDI